MYINLSDTPSIANRFIAEMRDEQIQKDSMRFRRNMERLGEVFSYEISKKLDFVKTDIETPLGISKVDLPKDEIVLATVLRAGLPFHIGFLNYFDHAENSFITAYRKHHKDGSFEINLQYITSPSIENKVLIINDPMLATGSSMEHALNEIMKYGTPKEIHVASIIASSDGVAHIKRCFPDAHIWVGAEDEELTAKSYIVPGMGDAGDLAFGIKLQA